MNKALERRMHKTSYRNFNVAIYCPVGDINRIKDLDAFEARFDEVFSGVKVGRVYLEDFRGFETCEKEKLIQVKSLFERKGIDTAGGITTCAAGKPEFGFASLCYSDESNQKMLLDAVKMNAEIFDEIIFDDFYFLNCRCEKCIAKKGNKSWKEFRLAQKEWVTKELVMKPAKEINPNINVIVKYPQWFEDFNETGYDLVKDTDLFDSIYTGTETRNPEYAQQHLPKYLSYFTMRYYGSRNQSQNLGGWFDPYECTYNLTSYLEQAYLTLFAKSKEVTLFCLGSLMFDPAYKLFPGTVGKLFDETDAMLDKLGNPCGVYAYHPHYGYGEKNLHSYLGQCGIPFEPVLEYPKAPKAVFLAESAADDKDIVDKAKATLLAGGDVVVTSGFVAKCGDAFEEFGHVAVTDKKAFTDAYCISDNHGVNIGRKIQGDRKIIIPILDYCTNDVWEIAGAYGHDNNFPIVLSWKYGQGTISVITVPDDFGDIYSYPREVLLAIRELFAKQCRFTLDAPAKVMLFAYDNDTAIVRSDLNYAEVVKVNYKGDGGEKNWEKLLAPGVNELISVSHSGIGSTGRYE